MTSRLNRILWASSLVVLLVGWAVPALAQNGSLAGKVVDVDGKGLAEATVLVESKGEPPRQFKILADKYGEWYKGGVPPGTYNISVIKEWADRTDKTQSVKMVKVTGTLPDVVVKPGQKVRVPDIGALTDAARAAGKRAPTASNLSTAEAAAANKRAAELEGLFKDANAATEAGNYAEAVIKLTSLAEKLAEEKRPCAACYAKIGESQLKLNAIDKAEAAFLKAIELDPNLPAPYGQLAAIYNAQSKFDDAAKMSTKASELLGASGGGAGGGGDPVTVFNHGIINWNAGKYEEAKAEFAKAAQLDPKMANAHYYLGMAIFNLASSGKGNMVDAKAPFQEYLKLAPTGEYAEVAKAILATIK